MSAGRPPSHHRPTQERAIDLRALLTQREYIKTTAYLLPRAAKIRVLEMMERLRRERSDPRAAGAQGQSAGLPEMSGAEMVREINWRLGTLPPGDTEAVARYIRRMIRWRSERGTRGPESRRAPSLRPIGPAPR